MIKRGDTYIVGGIIVVDGVVVVIFKESSTTPYRAVETLRVIFKFFIFLFTRLKNLSSDLKIL